MTATEMGVVISAAASPCWTDRERRLLLYLAAVGGSVEISTVYDWNRSGMRYTHASMTAKRLLGLGVLALVGRTISLSFDRLKSIAATFTVSVNLGVSFTESVKVKGSQPSKNKAIYRIGKSSTAEPPSDSPGLDSKESKHTPEAQGATGSSGTGERREVCVSAAPKKQTRIQSPLICACDVPDLVALGLDLSVAQAARKWRLWHGWRVVQIQRLQATRTAAHLAAGLDVVGWQSFRAPSKIGNPAAYLSAVLARIRAGTFIRPAGYQLPTEREEAAKAAAERDARLNATNAAIERQQTATEAMATALIAKLDREQFDRLRKAAEKRCRQEVGEGPEIPEVYVRAAMNELALEEAHAAP